MSSKLLPFFVLNILLITFGDGRSIISDDAVNTTSKYELTNFTVRKLDTFHCGTEGIVSVLAEQKVLSTCPSRYDEANSCCFDHDNCYADQLGQEYCDTIFCECLTQFVGDNKTDRSCVSTANFFCTTVVDFGLWAYKASESQKTTDELTSSVDTTQTSIEVKEEETTTLSIETTSTTTGVPPTKETRLLPLTECKEYMGISFGLCINEFEKCIDKEDNGDCDKNFCDCSSKYMSMQSVQYIHQTCENRLHDFCPNILGFSSHQFETYSKNIATEVWNILITYSNFIYFGLIIVFIIVYLYVKGYLHTYPLKYEQAPSELSQVGILNDLTMNMTDVTLLTPNKRKPSSSVNLENPNRDQKI
uniref:Phospholipase A2 domain-containing protein n=1 Tax=Parastrongyloides trichosuri TaxID=131310 RepID=A0A0N4ZSP8_PARTI